MPSSLREGLIPLLLPVSRGRHALLSSADSVATAVTERSCFKVDTDGRFREDRWDSSYHVYEDTVRVKGTGK